MIIIIKTLISVFPQGGSSPEITNYRLQIFKNYKNLLNYMNLKIMNYNYT